VSGRGPSRHGAGHGLRARGAIVQSSGGGGEGTGCDCASGAWRRWGKDCGRVVSRAPRGEEDGRAGRLGSG
jgi:hypothetical protein